MRAGDDEGAGLDAVGNDAVLRAVQFADALDADGGSARAFDLRAHLVEQVGQVGDFGLARAFCITVSPSARVAAMSRSSVPVTVILSKTISPP